MTFGTSMGAIEREADYRAAMRAKRDAQRSVIADLPDPKEYAFYLSADLAAMLLSATLRESWYVTETVAKKLRPLGLCDYASTGLTGFGMAVRRALKDMEL